MFDAGDTPFATTEIIRLIGNEAEQLVEAVYGHEGETGYRVAFVWDSQRRFTINPATLVQEQPNLYTTNAADVERFDVTIVDQDDIILPIDTLDILGTEFDFQTALIEQQFDTAFVNQAGVLLNFDTIFEKVAPWTRQAIVDRQGDLRVFTTVEVRNDQDINLFIGPGPDNSLNAQNEVLEAEFERAGLEQPTPSFDFDVNEFIDDPPVFEVFQQPVFVSTFVEPELKKMQQPGQLSWIAVKIESDDLSADDLVIEVDGELILKSPELNYEKLNSEDEPTEIVDAEKNEFDKIKEAIENDARAEAGYWYKVFVDEPDGSNKKDEVLFYYYKTGETDESFGPESDFEPSMPADPVEADDAQGEPGDDELPLEGPRVDNKDDVGMLIESRLEAVLNNVENSGNEEPSADSNIEELGLSSATLLMATLANKRSGNKSKMAESLADSEEISFSRFDRLKRNLRSLLGKNTKN